MSNGFQNVLDMSMPNNTGMPQVPAGTHRPPIKGGCVRGPAYDYEPFWSSERGNQRCNTHCDGYRGIPKQNPNEHIRPVQYLGNQ